MFSHYLATALGGGLGAVARVALSRCLPHAILGIPVQILLVNVVGCFLMGLLAELLAFYLTTSDVFRYFLIPGFLGGFTTFSAFSLEFGLLFQKQQYSLALWYVLSSFALSLLMFFCWNKAD